MEFYIVAIILFFIRFLFLLRNKTFYKRYLDKEPDTRLQWIFQNILLLVSIIDYLLFMPSHALAMVLKSAKHEETTKDDIVTQVIIFVFVLVIYFVIPIISTNVE